MQYYLDAFTVLQNMFNSYRLLHISLLITLLGCKERQSIHSQYSIHSPANESLSNKKYIRTLTQLSSNKTNETYGSAKKSINLKRRQLLESNAPYDSVKLTFRQSLRNIIIPFWEGTEWSFEGHTSKPQKGQIACGYFVSTTLKDVGLNLNRYKLAQQNPFNEAKTLALDSQIKIIENSKNADNIQDFQNYLKEEIYFIGYDQSHVGYITKIDEEIYLIHSNYILNVGVMIENISESEVFNNYNKFYIVELSSNAQLLQYWIEGKELIVLE